MPEPFVPRRIILRFSQGLSRDACFAIPEQYGHPVVHDGWRSDQSPCLIVLVPPGTEDNWLGFYRERNPREVLLASRARRS
ncbi:MAG: hypothetical protein IT406_03805 [Candidatus Yanofskybacteria bacterium]|nr:hypothetical protein [Candidatus Yanofskybacteria bacterium]